MEAPYAKASGGKVEETEQEREEAGDRGQQGLHPWRSEGRGLRTRSGKCEISSSEGGRRGSTCIALSPTSPRILVNLGAQQFLRMIPVQYLAGFVDGEGYLGLARIRRHHRSPEYCLRLSIYNTNRMILEDIQRTTGGTMSVIGERQAGRKVSYALVRPNATAAKLIRKIKPFLVVKSEQSKALLAFDLRIQAGHRLRDKASRLLPLTR